MFISNNSRFFPLCIWKYHTQIFLEECKYAKENIKTRNYIDKELKSESDSNSNSDSDSDNDSGTNNEEYI